MGLCYDPRVYYRGRGAFESMGTGLAMQLGDIAFKMRILGLLPVEALTGKRGCYP
ncbi:hypothetical protein MKX03_000226, partial [Papaver bracteatum]